MKKYVVPVLSLVEIRAEEMLAARCDRGGWCEGPVEGDLDPKNGRPDNWSLS